MLNRRLLPLVPLVAALATALVATAVPASAAPAARTPGRAIEAFARYEPQTTCSPTAKPGTVALRALVLHAYRGTGDLGIVRNCGIGGRSEHKEGRAWDWKVSVRNPAQVRAANDFFRFVLATDRYGNRAAMARRLGIMYMIWNHRIWSAGTDSWRPYTGPDPHTTHVHLSLTWAGALKRTSYWTGRVAPTVAAPRPPVAPKPVPAPAPLPKPAPTPAPVPQPTPSWPTPSWPTWPTGPQPDPSALLTGSATVVVPASSASGVLSRFHLAAGQAYRLQVTGTYDYGPEGMTADATCSVWPDGSWRRTSAWEADGTWTGPRGDLDLLVDGHRTRWSTADGSRCDTATHTYTTELLPGTTGPLALKVLDDTYDDNAGTLTVTVTPVQDGWQR